jgi:hypothetical protein
MLLLASNALDQAAPAYTVQDVTIRRHFAGQLGHRIQTELTLSSAGRTIKVTIKDCRHSRFQSAKSPFAKGDIVRLSGTGTELRQDQVKRIS